MRGTVELSCAVSIIDFWILPRVKISNQGPKHALTLSLRKLCLEEKNNFVISPLSLGAALAMLSAGLRSETKKEHIRFLDTLDEQDLHRTYTYLLSKNNLPLGMATRCVNAWVAERT